MSLPTRSETYVKLNEHLIRAQEDAAMMMHLHNTESTDKDKALARGWFAVSELFKKIQYSVTELAKGNLN